MFSSPQEIAIIVAVGFILFGSKKLPEMAKSLGSSIVEFKKAVKGDDKAETAANEGAVPGPAATQQAIPSSTGTPQQLALPAQSSETRRT